MPVLVHMQMSPLQGPTGTYTHVHVQACTCQSMHSWVHMHETETWCCCSASIVSPCTANGCAEVTPVQMHMGHVHMGTCPSEHACTVRAHLILGASSDHITTRKTSTPAAQTIWHTLAPEPGQCSRLGFLACCPGGDLDLLLGRFRSRCHDIRRVLGYSHRDGWKCLRSHLDYPRDFLLKS